MHKQAINHKQAIIGGGYLFTENACYVSTTEVDEVGCMLICPSPDICSPMFVSHLTPKILVIVSDRAVLLNN